MSGEYSRYFMILITVFVHLGDEEDTGSASSLINFIQSVLWSFGLILGVLPWSNYIDGLGIIILACTLCLHSELDLAVTLQDYREGLTGLKKVALSR